MRGFGTTLDFERGTSRSWYAGEDGIRRWADNDKPVDTPTPDAPEPLNDTEELK